MSGSPDPTLVALHRFGLGGRPGDWRRASADPRGFVRAQLDGPVPTIGGNLPASDEALLAVLDSRDYKIPEALDLMEACREKADELQHGFTARDVEKALWSAGWAEG